MIALPPNSPAPSENYPVIRMTADEVNCLVYAYLVDSGFKHTAFSLCMESRLENSPNFSKHIPRGELIDLLSKALLYCEVEAHWKADHLALNCKTGFSLLEHHHVCSLDPPKPKPSLQHYLRGPLMPSNGVTSDGKRKASPGVDGPAEKRARHDGSNMDNDSSRSPDGSAKKPKSKPPRQQGPADNETNAKAILTLSNHETEVFVCAFNPAKPSLLASGSKDAVINIWDLPDPPLDLPGSSEFAQPPGQPRKLELSDNQQGDLTALHWNPDGTLIAVGSYDSVLRVCTAEGELYFTSTQHQGPIFAVRFSRDGKWLLSASLDCTVCLWDVVTKELHTQYRVHTDCCLDVEWLSDTSFASCAADQLIQIMEIGKPEAVKTLSGHDNEVNQIKSNVSGTRLASCSDDMTARIWKLKDSPIPASEDSLLIPGLSDDCLVLLGHTHSVSTIGWCPNPPPGTNEIIATSSFDGTARLWDAVTGECLKTFNDHKLPVYALKFSPTGRWMTTGSGDGWVHVYDVQGREMKWSWFAGYEKPGVFEIDWQTSENVDRISLALECRSVAVIDVSKIPALQRRL